MNLKKLAEKLKELNQPSFRLKQIIKAVYKDGIGSFSDMTNLPTELRTQLDNDIDILPFEAIKVLKSKEDDTYKAVLKLKDDLLIETVIMSLKEGIWSACLSTQVGCALGCRFCATGKMGIKRDLTAEEIADQVLFWKQYIKKENIEGGLENIVYMGMGEPFMNWDNVTKSLDELIDPDLLGYGSRAISVSTSGVADRIVEFGRRYPQMNLAISLHFADDNSRSEYMPINRRNNLNSIRKAIEGYFKVANRKIFIEYIMLAGVNDRDEDAHRLAKFLKSIEQNHLLHVNLIRYNLTVGEMVPSPVARTQEFMEYLKRMDLYVTIRKRMGEDIKGGCGQLAGAGK